MNNKKLILTRFIMLTVAVACILSGIYRGEVYTVLNKAIHICMECIGIG